MHNGRLNGVLAVSRAFGDVEHKLLKEKCWDKPFVSDPLIVDPVSALALIDDIITLTLIRSLTL